MKNLAGASFDNETLRWVNPLSVVTLQQYSSDNSAVHVAGWHGGVWIVERQQFDKDAAAELVAKNKVAKSF